MKKVEEGSIKCVLLSLPEARHLKTHKDPELSLVDSRKQEGWIWKAGLNYRMHTWGVWLKPQEYFIIPSTLPTLEYYSSNPSQGKEDRKIKI